MNGLVRLFLEKGEAVSGVASAGMVVSALGITAAPVTVLCELLLWGFLLTRSRTHTLKHADTLALKPIMYTYIVNASNQESFETYAVLFNQLILMWIHIDIQ